MAPGPTVDKISVSHSVWNFERVQTQLWRILRFGNTDSFIFAAINTRQKKSMCNAYKLAFYTAAGVVITEWEHFIHPKGRLLMSQYFCLARKCNKRWLQIKKEPEVWCHGGCKSREQGTTLVNPWEYCRILFFNSIMYLSIICSFICQPQSMIKNIATKESY